MCELVSILGAALSAARSISSNRQAQAQFRVEQQRQAQRQALIRAEAIAEFDAGQRRRDAEREALVRQNSENRRRELEARATARTRAGETGLDASHVDRAIAFDASTARTDARRDFQRFSRDIDQNLEDVERGATSQLNAIRPPTPPAPLGFELGELALSAIRRG